MLNVVKGICNILHIKQLRTSVYHPQTYGLVERFNHTLKNMLRACIQGDPSKWELIIPQLLFSVREAPQTSTGYVPFELVYGQAEMVTRCDL